MSIYRRLAGLAALAFVWIAPATALDLQSTTVPGRVPGVNGFGTPLTNAEIAINRADKRLIFKNLDGTLGYGSLLNAVPPGRKSVEEGDASDLCVRVPGSPVCRPQRDRATDNDVQASDWGMVCDGVADASPGLITATNVALVLRREVILPPGTCRLLTYLAPPSKTHWNGRGLTTLYFDPAMTMTPAASTGGLAVGMALYNVTDIDFRGIIFQGAGANYPSAAVSQPKIAASNARSVRLTNVTVRDFGRPGHAGDGNYYAQGIIAFGGGDWVVEKSRLLNNTGDGAAWSNETDGVEVFGSLLQNNDDSGLVCAAGGKHVKFHDNTVIASATSAANASPPVVFDRCTDALAYNNTIIGAGAGVGIRAARYYADAYANQRITLGIAGNMISNVAAGVGIENVAPGGGVWTVTGNTVTGAAVCIGVTDSESGSITGNTCSGITDTAILLNAASAGVNTGSVAVSGNTAQGSGGSFGIRQIAGAGTLTPSAISPTTNVMVGFGAPYALATNGPLTSIPAGAPDASRKPCQQGQLLGVDYSYLYVCSAFGVVGKSPLTSTAQ